MAIVLTCLHVFLLGNCYLQKSYYQCDLAHNKIRKKEPDLTTSIIAISWSFTTTVFVYRYIQRPSEQLVLELPAQWEELVEWYVLLWQSAYYVDAIKWQPFCYLRLWLLFLGSVFCSSPLKLRAGSWTIVYLIWKKWMHFYKLKYSWILPYFIIYCICSILIEHKTSEHLSSECSLLLHWMFCCLWFQLYL